MHQLTVRMVQMRDAQGGVVDLSSAPAVNSISFGQARSHTCPCMIMLRTPLALYFGESRVSCKCIECVVEGLWIDCALEQPHVPGELARFAAGLSA